MSTGLLSLDYDRIISQWGDSSMFACDGSADELGDLLQQLEDDTCDTQAWLDCEASSTTRPASVPQQPQRMMMAQQQVFKQQDTQQQHPRPAPVTPFMAAHEASKAQQQQQQQQRQQAQQRSQQSSEGVVPSHSARAPAWWVDPSMSDMATAAFGKDDHACRAAFDAFGNAFSPQLSSGRQNSSEPCIVPDTSVPPPPPLAHSSYGLVPQALPSPVSYMCMPPMPMAMPPMMPMPAAAAALLQPQATHPTALSEQANDMLRLRQECLKRYRDKKARRMYTKMVRYQLRKINADKRPRIKGRFVKKTEEELAAAAGGSLPPTPKGAASKDGSSESTTVIDECLSDSSL